MFTGPYWRHSIQQSSYATENWRLWRNCIQLSSIPMATLHCTFIALHVCTCTCMCMLCYTEIPFSSTLKYGHLHTCLYRTEFTVPNTLLVYITTPESGHLTIQDAFFHHKGVQTRGRRSSMHKVKYRRTLLQLHRLEHLHVHYAQSK